MSTIQHARRVLGDAESALRAMMEQGLREQRYGDVAAIAQLANGLAALLRAPAEGLVVMPLPSSLDTSPARQAAPPRVPGRPSGRGSSRGFPRFHRDGNRLVKVGWSKKRRQEYEHRAPRDSVEAFARHLGSKVSKGRVFTMENLLPLPDLRGAEVPSYQAYLCLAWLKEVGVLQRKGKDGYILAEPGLDQNRLEELWNSLPSNDESADQ